MLEKPGAVKGGDPGECKEGEPSAGDDMGELNVPCKSGEVVELGDGDAATTDFCFTSCAAESSSGGGTRLPVGTSLTDIDDEGEPCGLLTTRNSSTDDEDVVTEVSRSRPAPCRTLSRLGR